MDGEALYLDGRGLAAVPDEVRGMHRLRHLDLRDNRLTTLPGLARRAGRARIAVGRAEPVGRRAGGRDGAHAPAPPVRARARADRGAGGDRPPARARPARQPARRICPERLDELPWLEKLDLRWNRFLDLPPAAERLAARGCVVLA